MYFYNEYSPKWGFFHGPQFIKITIKINKTRNLKGKNAVTTYMFITSKEFFAKTYLTNIDKSFIVNKEQIK